MKNKYIPNVGDIVELIISDRNFNSKMISIVENNPIVKVTKVFPYHDLGYRINFDNDGNYDWTTFNNHFKPIKTARIIDDLQSLKKLLENIK